MRRCKCTTVVEEIRGVCYGRCWYLVEAVNSWDEASEAEKQALSEFGV